MAWVEWQSEETAATYLTLGDFSTKAYANPFHDGTEVSGQSDGLALDSMP